MWTITLLRCFSHYFLNRLSLSGLVCSAGTLGRAMVLSVLNFGNGLLKC